MDEPRAYDWLNAAQLIKHAFGLDHSFPENPLLAISLLGTPGDQWALTDQSDPAVNLLRFYAKPASSASILLGKPVLTCLDERSAEPFPVVQMDQEITSVWIDSYCRSQRAGLSKTENRELLKVALPHEFIVDDFKAKVGGFHRLPLFPPPDLWLAQRCVQGTGNFHLRRCYPDKQSIRRMLANLLTNYRDNAH